MLISPRTRLLRSATCGLALAGLLSTGLTAQAQDEHPGKAIYDDTCAVCHDNPEATKSPALETLKSMRVQQLSYALNQGKMQTQAAGLSEEEKSELIDYLVGSETVNDDWIQAMACDSPAVELGQPATVTGFGFGLDNHRQLTAEQAGLTTADFANLELAWVMAFPKATTMRSQAAVVGDTLFLPVHETSKLFALDISGEPCLKWVYNSPIPLRSSAAFGTLSNGRQVAAVSDQSATVHLLDAGTGEPLWTQPVGVSEWSITTGTPVIADDKVIVPVSQYEISLAGNPAHQCCTSHGAVTAIDANSGEKIWTAHTMPDAKPIRDRGDGQMIWGPSGAPIWNSPAVDTERGLVYVGTGEATSEPAHENTDAILAIDLEDGHIAWSFQATANDIFVMGCGYGRSGPNCPKPEETVARDVDFGASVIIAQDVNGRDLLLAGQKSGTVWALDPDNKGKVVWRRDIGEGSPLGGIHWGIAYDGKQVYAPINRPFGFRPGPDVDKTLKPGLYALDVASGELTWDYGAEPDCDNGRKERMKSCDNPGFSGAPTVIDGAVITGALDGYLRAFDSKTGKLLFEFDTADSFDTINGVEGKGGAIDNASIIAANGYLFVNSGYGMFGQVGGNLMLAFKPKTSP